MGEGGRGKREGGEEEIEWVREGEERGREGRKRVWVREGEMGERGMGRKGEGREGDRERNVDMEDR